MILQENPHKPTDEKYQSGCLGVATHNDYGGRNTNLFDLGKRFLDFFRTCAKRPENLGASVCPPLSHRRTAIAPQERVVPDSLVDMDTR